MNVTEKTLFDIVGTILDECWKDFYLLEAQLKKKGVL